MSEEKRGLVDNDVIVRLFDDFEAQRRVLRRNRNDVVVSSSYPSSSDLWNARRGHRVFLSLSGATPAVIDWAGRNTNFCGSRDYVRNRVQQVPPGREFEGAFFSDTAIPFSVSPPGRFRVVFGGPPF